MRWMWIDTVVAYEPGRRMVAVKNVSLAEEHLHDHFPDQPVMPASLMVEGMAQTAGILVGSTRGTIERLDHRTGTWERIGTTEIVFSHIDQNRSGLAFPEENFVFGENFRTLLRGAGLDRMMAAARA